MLLRVTWGLAGAGLVAVGLVGGPIPGFPTSVCLALAALCWARSSTRFERWLLSRPHAGALFRSLTSAGMSVRAKAIGVVLLWAGIGISLLVVRWWGSPWWLVPPLGARGRTPAG
jgi:uncharacterized membrane protein YbaN (DUF454 family)